MSNGMMGYILAFTLGGAVGAAVTWKMLKDKYEQEIQNEITALRELRNKTATDDNTPQEPVEDEKIDNKKTAEEYARLLTESEYTPYGKPSEIQVDDIPDQPYVIAPEEFAMLGYKVESLVYYTDGVLADDSMKPVDDIDETVGEESLARFGEYEDDAVHVRNELLRTDFEILRSEKSYSEALAAVHLYDVEE